MKIRTTLIASSAVMITGLALVAFFSIYALFSIRSSINGLTARSTPLQIKTTELQKVVEGLSGNLMQLGVATDQAEVRRLSATVEVNRKQLESLVSDIARLDASRSAQVDVTMFRNLHDTVQKAVEERLRNAELFRADAARMDAALGQVEKALLVVRREIANLSDSGATRVNGAVSSSAQLFATNAAIKDMMLNLREIQVALSNLELAKSKNDGLAVKQKIKLLNGSIQSVAIDDPVVREVKKEVTAIYDDFVRPGDGLIALKGDILAGKNVENTYQVLKKRQMNILTEANLKLSTLLDGMERKVSRNRSEVETALLLRQKIAAVSDAVNLIIGDSRSLETKARLLMLSDNEQSYAATVEGLRGLQAKLRTALNSTRSQLGQLQQPALLRSMSGSLSAFGSAEASIERIIATQKSILASNAVVARTVTAVKESTLKEVQAGESLVKETSSKQEKMVARVNNMVNRQMIVILGVSVLVAAVALLSSFLTNRRVSGSLRRMTALLQDVAHGEGDLTKRLDESSRDEFADASCWFNTFIGKLSRIIAVVADNTNQVSGSATQLKGTASQISGGAEQVMQQATAVATSSEQLAATSLDIARNCTMAAESSRRATASATSGAQVVGEAVSGMNRIADRVKGTSVTMQALGARSEEISRIIATIEDIADQTNLLALNAAIEAARAGEEGRGFAVVADQVRALASRTSEATGEIDAVIKGIVAEISNAVRNMEQGVSEAENGKEAAAKSGRALEEIITLVGEASMQIAQVATAAEQQTATTAEINQNIAQISDVVRRTSNDADETLRAADQMAGLAEELKRQVGQFKLS